MVTKNNKSINSMYVHARWNKQRHFLRFLLKTIAFTLLVKLEKVEGLENIPHEGAAILYINHIAFVDPIVLIYVVPRNIVPLAKIEVYNYPVVGIFPKLWGVIPVRREEFDRRAIHQVIQVLQAGEIVLVAPEGTRHPQLARGKQGVAYLACRTNTPLIPVAIQGTPGFPAIRLSKRWRGPGAQVCIGEPFYFREKYQQTARLHLQQMTDEAMYILARMLPESLRGDYRDLSLATNETIEWL